MPDAPDFLAICEEYQLAPEFADAMRLKWTAGALRFRHRGGTDDMADPEFDHLAAIAGEAIDAICYAMEGVAQGKQLHDLLLLSVSLLDACGPEAAMAAARAAMDQLRAASPHNAT